MQGSFACCMKLFQDWNVQPSCEVTIQWYQLIKIGVYLQNFVKVCLSRLDITCMEVCQDNFPARLVRMADFTLIICLPLVDSECFFFSIMEGVTVLMLLFMWCTQAVHAQEGQ